MMDIEKLKIIVAFVEEGGSYKKTAKRLNISPETVANFIGRFEQETQTKVFERGFVDFFLTGQGQAL